MGIDGSFPLESFSIKSENKGRDVPSSGASGREWFRVKGSSVSTRRLFDRVRHRAGVEAWAVIGFSFFRLTVEAERVPQQAAKLPVQLPCSHSWIIFSRRDYARRVRGLKWVYPSQV